MRLLLSRRNDPVVCRVCLAWNHGCLMLRSLLASTGVALFAFAGCEDILYAEPAGETQVVYLNGEPDHCIVASKGSAQPEPSQSNPQPAVAEGR
jgi:hypothetical protein